jgi:6-phosphogluconolactonase (cycloisomerase 2 family)
MNLDKVRAVLQHRHHGEDRAVLFSLRETGAKLAGFAKRLRPSRFGRLAKVSILSLAVALGLSSCSLDYVAGYVYITTAKSNPGVIDQYSVDYQTGALGPIGTPVAAGNNPTRLIASPSGKFVYVINTGDSTVQEFAVQGDGTLASKNTYATGGSHPAAIAIDPQGAFLYIANTCTAGAYSSTTNACTAGSGVVSIFPVNGDNSLGTVSLQPVGNNPVGISISYFNRFVYVLDQETTSTPQILGFSQNATTGALTPVTGTTIATVSGKTVATGYAAGVAPSAIAEEPTSRFVYVTDQAANQLIGYTVLPSGALLAMVNGPFPTGLFPISLAIDPQGTVLYVLNYNANTLEGFAIDEATGTPSAAAGAYQTAVGTGPTCAAIDPALGIYLYVSNSLDNTLSAERLDPSTGGLSAVPNAPFSASGQPTCVTVVPNGAHATQLIQP